MFGLLMSLWEQRCILVAKRRLCILIRRLLCSGFGISVFSLAIGLDNPPWKLLKGTNTIRNLHFSGPLVASLQNNTLQWRRPSALSCCRVLELQKSRCLLVCCCNTEQGLLRSRYPLVCWCSTEQGLLRWRCPFVRWCNMERGPLRLHCQFVCWCSTEQGQPRLRRRLACWCSMHESCRNCSVHLCAGVIRHQGCGQVGVRFGFGMGVASQGQCETVVLQAHR